MSKKKDNNQPVEVHLQVDGLGVTVTPRRHSADLDQLLERKGANSFVFIPLAPFGGKKRRKKLKAQALARKNRKKLPEGTWFDGELRCSKCAPLGHFHVTLTSL